MIARITSNQWIHFENITAWEESMLDVRFSAENPYSGYIDDATYQTWDGVYRRYHKKDKKIARPYLAELRALAKLKRMQLVVQDDRPPAKYKPIPKSEVDEHFLPGITLKKFQVDAVHCIWTTEVGIFDVSVGGGKTELMAAICKAIRCPTAIIAEQRIVIDQAKERLELREVCDEPGLFYAGKMPNGQLIIIGTIQSLIAPPKKPQKPDKKNYKDTKASTAEQKYKLAQKRYEVSLKAHKSRTKKAKAVRALVQKCDMLLVDEADLAVSTTYKKLFRYWFKGRRRYGFTGTPYDECKPVQKLILQEHLGSVIFRQDRHQVQASGLTVPIEYHMLVVGDYEDKTDSTAFDIAINEFIIYNTKFHKLVAALCARHTHEGTLILVERDDLGEALKDIIPDCDFVHGKTPKSRRSVILNAFEERKLKVLIGGKNVRRGMDLDGGCENMVLTTGGKLKSEFDQRLGRARRLNRLGKSRVYDFYFLCNKYLYEHSRLRLKAAVEMGCDTSVVFPDGSIDGKALIRSRFRRPRFSKSRT